jgi:hypothetical protein
VAHSLNGQPRVSPGQSPSSQTSSTPNYSTR